MQPVEYFTWLLPDDDGRTTRPSRFKLTRQQAGAYPGAVCVDSSREVRMQPLGETADRAADPLRVVAVLPKGLPSGVPR